MSNIIEPYIFEAIRKLSEEDFLLGKWNSFYVDGKEYAIKIEERKP